MAFHSLNASDLIGRRRDNEHTSWEPASIQLSAASTPNDRTTVWYGSTRSALHARQYEQAKFKIS